MTPQDYYASIGPPFPSPSTSTPHERTLNRIWHETVYDLVSLRTVPPVMMSVADMGHVSRTFRVVNS